MRILLSNNFFYPNMLGGAEKSVETLGRELVARGHEVHVLCHSGTAETQRFEHEGMAVTALGRTLSGTGPTAEARSSIGRLHWHLSAAADRGWTERLRTEIAAISPDIVNTFNLAGVTTRIWHAVRALDLPLVHTLFGTYLVCFRGPMFRGGADCGTQCRDCQLLTARRRGDSALVDAVMGDSRAVLGRHLDSGYFGGVPQQGVINCGFAGGAALSPDDADAPRPPGPLKIGFMGRLHPTKGVNVLLDACEKLAGTDGWELQIAGSGSPEQEARLTALGEKDNRVRFLGWQDTRTFLSGIDISVVPSIWNDPLPRVVFESFCAGLPVIGSRIGGIPEMIEPGTTGDLVEPGDAAALAGVLKTYIANPDRARAMRGACLSKAGHFTSARFAEDYLTLYSALLPARGSGRSAG